MYIRVTLITYLISLFQGDRGYEGPKGSRGPPGLGIKGDQVWWTFNPLKAQALWHYVFQLLALMMPMKTISL